MDSHGMIVPLTETIKPISCHFWNNATAIAKNASKITCNLNKTNAMNSTTLPSQIHPAVLPAADELAEEFSMSFFHLHTAQHQCFEFRNVIKK